MKMILFKFWNNERFCSSEDNTFHNNQKNILCFGCSYKKNIGQLLFWLKLIDENSDKKWYFKNLKEQIMILHLFIQSLE